MQAVINFKIDKKIKKEAQEIAGEMGLNLTDVLNVKLREFVQERELRAIIQRDESKPSKRLIESIREAEEELVSDPNRKFMDADEAITFLDQFIDKDINTKNNEDRLFKKVPQATAKVS